MRLINQNKTKTVLFYISIILLLWIAVFYRLNYNMNPCLYVSGYDTFYYPNELTTINSLNLTPAINQELPLKYVSDDTNIIRCTESDKLKFDKNKIMFKRLNSIGYLLITGVFLYLLYDLLKNKGNSYLSQCLSEFKQGINRLEKWFDDREKK